MNTKSSYLESKSHYQILDGLRGVASIIVVVFHVFETFNVGDRFVQVINHGYLAVDFFLCYPVSSWPMRMMTGGAR